jgi:hypothetical protein
MKGPVTSFSAILLSAALVSPLMAQTAPINTRYRERHSGVEGFDGYLDHHPDVSRKLSKKSAADRRSHLPCETSGAAQLHRSTSTKADAFRLHTYVFEHREHVYNRSEERWERHHHNPVSQ